MIFFDYLIFFSVSKQVSEELIRVAILWHEMWHEGLEEASRLYFGERNVKGMFEVLEPLHAMMERGPQTLKETSFNQVLANKLLFALKIRWDNHLPQKNSKNHCNLIERGRLLSLIMLAADFITFACFWICMILGDYCITWEQQHRYLVKYIWSLRSAGCLRFGKYNCFAVDSSNSSLLCSVITSNMDGRLDLSQVGKRNSFELVSLLLKGDSIQLPPIVMCICK